MFIIKMKGVNLLVIDRKNNGKALYSKCGDVTRLIKYIMLGMGKHFCC